MDRYAIVFLGAPHVCDSPCVLASSAHEAMDLLDPCYLGVPWTRLRKSQGAHLCTGDEVVVDRVNLATDRHVWPHRRLGATVWVVRVASEIALFAVYATPPTRLS